MTANHAHAHAHAHDHQHGVFDDAALADMIDLDGEVLAGYLDEVTAWTAGFAPQPGTIVDLGPGTGTGTAALARRFPDASIVALDASEPMLDRVRAKARELGLDGRVRAELADVDARWPDTATPDLVWTVSTLHHLADPERVLRDVHAALAPDGVVVAVEMDDQPRFLTDDGGTGLEDRARAVMADAGWNAHPDYQPLLERVGFEVTRRRFTIDVAPLPDSARRYALAFLGRLRVALSDRLGPDDLALLDRLVAADGPESVLVRDDLAVRGTRTAWVGRRTSGRAQSRATS
ncbi:trans-aconitate 2-methyltransferase [Pseudonocardia sp. KRD291]|uniref:class I SAM-dependent methyltransferase n=1 Tax=Pseudonocardia sp. KRD291 TaxID=2792007 RepID=UPI001C49F09B|nr:class I SAM-dependent methyltransferase [Pseudonocardia sp. KRD291]MBW0104581.1 class I SAM-dependent methyltransferase [Pseudonocardia sp. KRD291]